MFQLRPREEALTSYITNSGTIIGVFKGRKEPRQDLDIRIKILRPGIEQIPIQPLHSFWVVDLLLKSLNFKEDILRILDHFIDMCVSPTPFAYPDQRVGFVPSSLVTFESLLNRNNGELRGLDYDIIILELFVKNEKRTPGVGMMFENLLRTLKDYFQDRTNLMDVLIAAEPRVIGRLRYMQK